MMQDKFMDDPLYQQQGVQMMETGEGSNNTAQKQQYLHNRTEQKPSPSMTGEEQQELAPAAVVVETVESEEENSKGGEPDEPPRDNLERNVAMIVQLALTFFALLFVGAIVMALALVSQFNVIIVAVSGLLITMVIGFGVVMDKAMRHDPDWKPVRSRIRKLNAFATAAIVREVQNFQHDWNQHLMLTDGTVDNPMTEDDILNANENGTGIHLDSATVNKADKKRKKSATRASGKSVMFQFVKPFLKIRRLRRNKKSKSKTENVASDNYVPPVV